MPKISLSIITETKVQLLILLLVTKTFVPLETTSILLKRPADLGPSMIIVNIFQDMIVKYIPK